MKIPTFIYFLILLQLLHIQFISAFSGNKSKIFHASVLKLNKPNYNIFYSNLQGDNPKTQPQTDQTLKKYECVSCSYVYDEAVG